ncbi:MAG TPA: IclR family transcriptional regulator, partial [Acidimicrobiales bacterium]|nr:IclR family transcriptional regulator [Acidimicrobiales bacterium]
MAAPSVLGKVRSILDSLADGGVLGLSELARRSGVAKPTVHRLCGELIDWGVVERSGDAFRLGPKLFELGGRVPGRRQFREAALPFVEDLFVATGQTVHLAVLDGHDVFYIERLTGRRFRPAPSAVADRLPLHCTATGKCLLAFGPPELLDAVVASGLPARTERSITDGAELAAELDRV